MSGMTCIELRDLVLTIESMRQAGIGFAEINERLGALLPVNSKGRPSAKRVRNWKVSRKIIHGALAAE